MGQGAPRARRAAQASRIMIIIMKIILVIILITILVANI